MSKIRVILADDHAMLRSGLRMLINSQPDIEVVAEAGDFNQTVVQVEKAKADVAVLDLTMPGATGLSGISKLLKISPATRVLVLTMHDDPAILRSAMAMGASGYIVKSAADQELITAIRAVSKGRIFIDVQSNQNRETPTSANVITANVGRKPIDTLSTREKEVLTGVALGETNQALADRIGLSVKTVESYRARVMEKLSLKNRADLIRLAMECGILQNASDAKNSK